MKRKTEETSRYRFQISYLVILSLLIPMFIFQISGSQGIPDTYPTRREYSSLSGEFNITDVETTRFIGDEYYRNMGKLGAVSLMRDLNRDGYDDMILCAPGAPGSGEYMRGGKAFIWFGRGDILPEMVDLSETDPNVTIHGGFDDAELLSDIRPGDFDGDGILDWAIGNPSEPTAGKLYILWGDYWWENGTFPSEIELISPGKDRPGSGSPLGFYRTEKWTVASGPIGTSVYAPYQVGNSLISEDIDGDGTDDLIVTLHGWNRFTILWGTDSKWTFGGPKSTIIEDTWAFYGSSIDIGDIDGDGSYDLVVGAPTKTRDETNTSKAGAVFVYYDIANNGGGDSTSGARPIIYGDHDYDNFGTCVKLEDLDGDGKDDIIIGAPSTDGPNGNRKDAGSLQIFMGKEEERFPMTFSAVENVNRVIHGLEGGVDDIPGDKLGNSFDIGDIDFDGDKDLIIGLYGRSTDDTIWVGSILGYDGETIFNGKKTIDLRDIPFRFRFWGVDQEDSLGSSLALGDFNGDGAEDIITGSPGADGEGNSRPRCGEVYMLLGSAVIVRSLDISGPATIGGEVFAGSGCLEINITYLNTYGASDEDALLVRVDPEGENITIMFNEQGVSLSNVRFDSLELIAGSGHGIDGVGGWFKITLDIGWYVPLGKDVTVRVALETLSGDLVHRDFEQAFTVVRDVELAGRALFFRNGREMVNTMEWVRHGDNISFSNLSIIYSARHHKEVPLDTMGLALLREEDPVMDIEYKGRDWMMWDTIPERDIIGYSIVFLKLLKTPPQGIPPEFLPQLGEGRSYTFRADLNAPSPPTNLTLLPDGEEEGLYDDDTEWTVSWNGHSTLNGSGIRHHLLSVYGSKTTVARSLGGIRGTYYRNHNFTDPAFERNDYRVDFNWREFGPAWEDGVAQGFSVRWMGWISLDGYPSDSITLSGTGEARVYIDGEMIIDWSLLSHGPKSGDLGISGFVPIEVYYRTTTNVSAITLGYSEITGRDYPVGSDHLKYPSESASIELIDEGAFDVSVRAVDWTGMVSDSATVTGIVDLTPPQMDLSSIPSWTRDINPVLEISVRDPDIDDYPGSGIGDLQYRITTTRGAQVSDWTDENVTYSDGVFTLTPGLHEDFQDFIEFRVSDSVGNTRESTMIRIAVDLEPPDISLLGPDLSIPINSESVTLYLEARDLGGSGVDGDSFYYRIGMEHMSDWIPIEGFDSGETVPIEIDISPGYGVHDIQFSVSDNVGNTYESDIFKLTLEEVIIDEAPIPLIASPKNGSTFSEGAPVIFDATGTIDDGEENPDHLSYVWYSDRMGILGTGMKISIRPTRGAHLITLYVTDGSPGHNVSVSANITIVKPESPDINGTDEETEEKDHLWVWLAVSVTAILILATALVILFSYRRSVGEETRMELRSRSEDDLEYEGSEKNNGDDY